MKRYLVFAGVAYYPTGGWDDFDSAHHDLSEAVRRAHRLVPHSFDWSHVVDLNQHKTVHTV